MGGVDFETLCLKTKIKYWICIVRNKSQALPWLIVPWSALWAIPWLRFAVLTKNDFGIIIWIYSNPLYSTMCEFCARPWSCLAFYAIWHFEKLARQSSRCHILTVKQVVAMVTAGGEVRACVVPTPDRCLRFRVIGCPSSFIVFAQCPTFTLWNLVWLKLWFILFILRERFFS